MKLTLALVLFPTLALAQSFGGQPEPTTWTVSHISLSCTVQNCADVAGDEVNNCNYTIKVVADDGTEKSYAGSVRDANVPAAVKTPLVQSFSAACSAAQSAVNP